MATRREAHNENDTKLTEKEIQEQIKASAWTLNKAEEQVEENYNQIDGNFSNTSSSKVAEIKALGEQHNTDNSSHDKSRGKDRGEER